MARPSKSSRQLPLLDSSHLVTRVGIDENGLGPQLGPLIVTGVRATIDSVKIPDPSSFASVLDNSLLNDSKKLVAHGDVAVGEAWARAVFSGTGNPFSLLKQLSLDDYATLTAPCPSGLSPQCWGIESIQWAADSALVDRVEQKKHQLALAGITKLEAKCVVLCPSRLHDRIAARNSLFLVDLEAMERLIIALGTNQPNLSICCGKVGALTKYLPHLRSFSGSSASIVEENRPKSCYQFSGFGQVEFVQDADASDPLVALASLIGKYIRELLMGSIVSYWKSRDNSLTNASGYHDPVTAKFVLNTVALREKENVPNRCFLRPTRGAENAPRGTKNGAKKSTKRTNQIP